MSFNQCPKRLWLEKNRKDLLPEGVDPEREKIFREAEEIELLAIELFPDVAQAYDRTRDFNHAFVQTRKLIAQGSATIYQPSFRTSDGRYCRCDIISRTADGGWDLYEVKSATRVKDEHLLDLAYQRLVLEDEGLGIRKVKVIHVNSEYVRHGPIDPKGMLTVTDVTAEVEAAAPRVFAAIGPAMSVMDSNDEPSVRILNQCNSPFECPFIDYCWQGIPEHSIYGLNLDDDRLAGFLDQGILLARDVPEEAVGERKRAYHRSLQAGKTLTDREEVSRWLGQIEYPLYHLDYETYASALPMFDGYHPYQQMPFQYSVHVQRTPGGEVEHHEYLADAWEDPVPKLAKALSGVIGERGTVLAWYKPFESGRNSEMAEMVPELAPFFTSVNERMLDLMDPFRNGHYVDPNFGGSNSIKSVLPVLAPDLSYERLEIGNGGLATVKWREMIDRKTDPKVAAKIRADLLEYCGQDTLAMVRILGVLEGV